MTLNLIDILLIFAVGGYGIYFFQSLRVRELALDAARQTCKTNGVQLLDGSVSVQRLSASRDSRGMWHVWRQYRFEYSVEGYERERGHVIMLGKRLQAVVMAERPEPPTQF